MNGYKADSLVTILVFVASFDKNKMAPTNKARVDQDAHSAVNLSWTDDEVELLVGAVRAYSSQKDYEGLEWESIKNKYEDIRKDFATLYEHKMDCHMMSACLLPRKE